MTRAGGGAWQDRARGQSTLEYILVVAAILAILITAAGNIGSAVTQTTKDAESAIKAASGKLPK